MAKRIPVIASHVDASLRNLLAILCAGGARDGEVEIESYVWPHRAKEQVTDGKLRAIKDSDGGVVAYKRLARTRHIETDQEWQKTRSGDVCTMQLKTGRRGRVVPASQQLATALG